MTSPEKPSVDCFGTTDAILEFAFRAIVMPLIPGTWMNRNLPKPNALTLATNPIQLEIVSHCWKYTEFQLYQLSSLVLHPPQNCTVTMTVFYSKEDANTVRLLDFFGQIEVPNVQWNFVDLPKAYLFRRSIGRNKAALESQAHWVWFTDCDVVFLEGALDSLAQQLEGCQERLVYPQEMSVSALLDADDPIIAQARQQPQVLKVDRANFGQRKFDRAVGPLQIVHGDVARACGYCQHIAVYQKPSQRWLKCHEDRALRWSLGTQGTPVSVPNLLFIRHAEKGRYVTDSRISTWRKWIRKTKSTWINR